MKAIETGMAVRLLVDDVTGGHQRAGMNGMVERKELDASGDVLFWVSSTRKREDGLTVTVRAPFYPDELEVSTNVN